MLHLHRLTHAGLTAAGVLWLMTAPAVWGQETRPGTQEQTPEPEAQERPSPLMRGSGLGPAPTYPALTSYPLELLGLLAPPTMRGPLTILPSIAISEEFNDNIFLDNRNKTSDFITDLSPAVMVLVNRRDLQLSAGYSFTAELYAKESNLSNGFSRHNFVGGALYEATRGLTLSLSDRFTLDRNTSAVSQGFTTGRQESWSNAVAPGMSWQPSQRTTLLLGGVYTVQRFEGNGPGADSDTYQFFSNLTYTFTPRFAGTLGYNFIYLDVQGATDPSATYNPTLGFSYRLTPSLFLSVNGGPAFTQIGGETFTSPAGTAILQQRFRFATASLQYDRSVAVAGGFGGTTDTQTVSGTLLFPWWRDFIFLFTPAYSTSESLGSGQAQRVDVKLFTVNIGVGYQVARYVTLFGGYNFTRQRTGGTSTLQFDADQNRVRVGIQFGYPFSFN